MRFVVCGLLLIALGTSADAQKGKKNPSGPSAALDLKGKSVKQYFEELLPGMGASDPAARSAPQQQWQRVCVHASAPGNEGLRKEASELMAAKLGREVPNAARIWLLTQLQRIGAEESVDAVAAAARDEDANVVDAALRSLATNASPRATAKLAELLDSSAKHKVGVVTALGHRRDAEAGKALAKALADKEAAVVRAAAQALARNPDAAAAKALAAARANARKDAVPAINDAYLACADSFLAAKQAKDARAIYAELNDARQDKGTRLAALAGVLKSSGDEAGTMILAILQTDDAAARAVAIGQIENLSASALKPLGQQMGKLAPASQAMVLNAIAARGDRAQLGVAAAALKSTDDTLRRAGIHAVGKLGDETSVPMLLDLAVGGSKLGDAAVNALIALNGKGVDEKLVATLEAEKTPAQAVTLIQVLGARKSQAAIAPLLKAAHEKDASVSGAALANLAELAEPSHVPTLLQVYLRATGKSREQAEQAIVAVSAKVADAEQRAEPALALLAKSPSRDDAAALLLLVGRLGGSKALEVVRASLKSSERHDAAVEALTRWPNDAAAETLLEVATEHRGKPADGAALRALARVCAVPEGSLPATKKLELLQQAMKLASAEADRKAILDHIGFVRHLETLHYVLPYLDDKALQQSACRAVVELAHSKNLREPNRAEFHQALDRVIAICTDRNLVERAKQYKQQ